MVYVHLAEGFEESEAIIPTDILRRGGVEVQLVSMTGAQTVTGAHGIKLESDILFDEADYDTCEMIVLPGGMPGTLNLQNHSGLIEKIKDFVEQDKYVAAICAAPMILGELGLLKGRHATIYPQMEEHLKGAKPLKDEIVVDDKFITAKGPAFASKFGYTLLMILKNEEIAEDVFNDMLYK